MKQKILIRLKSIAPPNSLRNQLLFRSLFILAVVLVLIGVFQYVLMRQVIYQNKAASMRGQVMAIPPFAWQHIGTNAQNSNKNTPPFLIPDTSLAFIDAQGNYFVLSKGPGGIDPPRLARQDYMDLLNKEAAPNPMAKKSGPDYQVVEAGGVKQLLVLRPVDAGPGRASGIVEISTLTGPLQELLVRQLLTFLFLSLLALLFGLLAFLPALRRTLVPLFNMIATAEQIDAGNLARRFPTRQKQMEIDRLAESFNGMLERLEASFKAERQTQEQMRRFVADASHELRTPLTSIRGFLEVLLRGAANSPDQLHKALTSMHHESERLSKLVHDLLFLAKLDRQSSIELKEGLLDRVIRDMEPQLRILAGGRDLVFQIEPDIRMKFDADKIKQVVLNLFENAVWHTDPNSGHIRISLSCAELSVQDNGPGIPAAHLPHVFDRFYRSDSSRTRKYGGAGLGLSITKALVEAHGGTIRVESEEGRGSIFRIRLPR